MVILLVFLSTISISFGNSELEQYIQRFKYKALVVPAKRPELYALGQKLFSDKILSGKNNISCESCHSNSGFSGDGLPLAVGEGSEGLAPNRIQKYGLVLGRHTQSIYNAGIPGHSRYFWDGRISKIRQGGWQTPEAKLNGINPELANVAATLESLLAVQTIFPLTSPEEMLGRESKISKVQAWEQVMKKIFSGTTGAQYTNLFSKAFPGENQFNIGHVGNALAEFIRHQFAATNTLWDLYLRGNKNVLSDRMKRGAIHFNSKAKCVFCHSGDHLSRFSLQNIGVPQIGPDDIGRAQITKNPAHLYQFRVPPLRNVGVTAPYMHSGVFQSLAEVINHYDDPIFSLRNFKWDSHHPNYREPLVLDTNSNNADNRERTLSRALTRSLNLTQEEKNDLVCFLAVALTDISLQTVLIKNGVVNEISDCSPRPL